MARKTWLVSLIAGLTGVTFVERSLGQSAMGNAVTYQGRLRKSDGTLVNATCSIDFSLWDAAGTGSPPTGGNQIGSTQSKTGIIVTDGLAVVRDLNFGAAAFPGLARWLQISVKCGTDMVFTPLSPRQALTPVPAALSLPGVAMNGGNNLRLREYNSIPEFVGEQGHGTPAATTAILLDETLVRLAGSGHNGTAFANGGWIEIRAAENWTPSAEGSYIRFVTSAIGQTGTEERMRIKESGTVEFPDDLSNIRAEIKASVGGIDLYEADGTRTVQIRGEESGGGADISLFNKDAVNTVQLDADRGGNGTGSLDLFDSTGVNTVTIRAWETSGGGGADVVLRNAAGVETIQFDADRSGDGRVITNVLEITGGSDLSEQFDVTSGASPAQPGQVVCIDPANPGKLSVCSRAYDRTVAGVISGAGGVKPGMLMGQRGSAADGEHAVALTGRVYVLVDASHGAIKPGDLLTTSPTAGHAMKVANHDQAQGAILGKAMTDITEGTGLVLVLVSLQ